MRLLPATLASLVLMALPLAYASKGIERLDGSFPEKRIGARPIHPYIPACLISECHHGVDDSVWWADTSNTSCSNNPPVPGYYYYKKWRNRTKWDCPNSVFYYTCWGAYEDQTWCKPYQAWYGCGTDTCYPSEGT